MSSENVVTLLPTLHGGLHDPAQVVMRVIIVQQNYNTLVSYHTKSRLVLPRVRIIERSASVSSTLHIASVHPVRQSTLGLSRSLQPGHQEILHYEEAEIMLLGLSHQYRLAPRGRDAGHGSISSFVWINLNCH